MNATTNKGQSKMTKKMLIKTNKDGNKSIKVMRPTDISRDDGAKYDTWNYTVKSENGIWVVYDNSNRWVAEDSSLGLILDCLKSGEIH
jgi:hypothetical protein